MSLLGLSRSQLHAKWKEWLPPGAVDQLCSTDRIIILHGDILQPNLGLTGLELDNVRHDINIIIHAASSINLIKPLHQLSDTIIEASNMMADLALTCKRLDRFVYVSTAYANTHYYARCDELDVRIDEITYPLQRQRSVLDELEEVRKRGTSQAYEAESFPWAYAYAKHLTERLLHYKFSKNVSVEKLLIIRPSVIGPSQALPFPGYNMPLIKIATKMSHPDLETHQDEVPVDVVADRLLCHLALGTHGCVHAVSGVRARMKYEPWRRALTKIRRIPWEVQPLWVKGDWKSPDQHHLARLYAVLGTSFAFSEDRTVAVYEKHPEIKDLGLQLFTDLDMGGSFLSRAQGIRYVMDRLAKRNSAPWPSEGIIDY
ncbi:male sterility domain-containing protein [Aspergillus campestris IBT 28561]|uniref:Fatty acyl-CoA reductase n=1 Tax=Aspergillus campestris (strain IBT 28561) TaxID=1392248 RepID=A0A2I1DCN1_ASPC2|nr:male sterility domain-containing protein [Aspergillus campestris IBT 28561]PKY07610.1 male sterility domain-containing protein [Aspergillus campestris IBT 28561]